MEMKQITHLILSLIIILILSCNSETESINRDRTLKKVSFCAPKTTDKAWYGMDLKAPKLEGLDGIDFPITTNNPETRQYFLQGFMLAYGFNHAEAARSFYESTRLDPECAMCWWGFAYVLGPNYNAGMEDDNIERAYDAIAKAVEYSENCQDIEKAMIHALAQRYGANAGLNRDSLNTAYSMAMEAVHISYPDNPDVGALYAESIMDLHPWDLWKKTGEAKPWTDEILSILGEIIDSFPDHPGANHFYIHAIEASKTPEFGLHSAKVLEDLVPGSGHLVHMPSHIYIRTGNYHEGSLANIRAVDVDSLYVEACHAQGAYPLAYYPHNWHFLAATATLEGQSGLAMHAAERLAEQIDTAIMQEEGWATLQHYYTIPYYVAVKLGKWDQIAQMEYNKPALIYPNSVLTYAMGMASLGMGNVEEAENYLARLKELSNYPVLEKMTIWDLNPMSDLIGIAWRILEAEIKTGKEEYDGALNLLTEAVAIEDGLNYNEPPDWFFSVRHHLGAVQIRAGNFEAAEAVYIEDLKTFPENGWALIGLHQAQLNLGKNGDAIDTQERFKAAWQWADIEISSSVPF